MKTLRALLMLLVALMPASPVAASFVEELQRFIHGEPPAPQKAPPPKQRAVVSTAAGATPDPQVEAFLRAFADALMAREGKPMLSRLSDKYAIDGLPAGAKATDVFLQATARIPGPTEMVVQSVERQGDNRSAKVEFRYSSADPKVKSLRFDSAGKLVWSDMFAVQTHRHGQ